MNLLFILDPLDGLKPGKDSSVAMMRAAAARGHALSVLMRDDLMLAGGVVSGTVRPLTLNADGRDWYRCGPCLSACPLADFDAVLMRQDPPFDTEYLYATHLLELAEAQGARVFNRPAALRDFNEKLAIARYPELAPPTLVTRRAEQIREFLAGQGDIILKPLDAMGGSSIFRLRNGDPNLNVIIETMTALGQRTVMAQRYLPEIAQGDKRILLIDGEPVPYALARIPREGETRGNLAAGGTGVAQALSDRDREIVQALGASLRDAGLFLAGLDVIGDWLTEINVTSPTCFQEIHAQSGFDVAGMFIDALERRAGGAA
jgi:glutathione synthase